MSSRADAWQRVIDGCRIEFPEAPDLFGRLWEHGRLSYAGVPVGSSGIDELSARILVGAIRRRGSLLVVLPDETARRSAVIFGSALLATSVQTLLAKATGVTVVLCGSSVDIRKHLAETRVQHLVLSSVFPQVHLQSDASHAVRNGDSIGVLARHLPKVICVLAPSEPDKILERYRPNWIAVECQHERDAQWLEGVAEWAKRRRTPVIGWVNGDRRQAIEVARKHQIRIFQWPLLRNEAKAGARDVAITGEGIVLDERQLVLTPVLLRSNACEKIASFLGRASIALARCQGAARSSSADDSLRLAWRYVRTVEWLPVPVSFYEEECKAFWGLKPLGQLSHVTGRFANAIRQSDIEVAKLIDDAVSATDLAVESMRQDGVPVWDALKMLCIGSSNDNSPREILFLGRSRRRLVELALVGLEGVTPADLAEVGVHLSDITQRRRGSDSSETDFQGLSAASTGNTDPELFVVGLPNRRQLESVYSIAGLAPLAVLLYPYQGRLVQSRLEQYIKDVGINNEEQLRALRECGVSLEIAGRDTSLAAHMKVNGSADLVISGEAQMGGTATAKPSEWGRLFSDAEVHALLGTGEDDADAAEDVVEEIPPGEEQGGIELAVESAVELTISGRRKGLFTADYMVNVVRVVDGRETILERTVRSLKVGDRMVLVHGQRRQSLYDLLLTRVHRHPSLQLHLALIKTWQEEIAASFAQWRKSSGKGYSELLGELQRAGSVIQSTLALRFWTEGHVLCPQDSEDLARIAGVLEMKFTGEHHSRIAKAAERLRGLHRGLALRLNHWLRREASGAQHDSEDELIDAELGLSLRDFKDSLEIVTIEGVVEREGLFLAATLNVFRPY